MKKLFLPFIICGLISLAVAPKASAQADFGLRAGINFANVNDRPDNFDPDSRTGLMVGGYLNFKVPMSPISIQPEAIYSQKGFKIGNGTAEVDYLEIPVLAKFSFAPGPVQPHVYFGPYAGFVLNSEVSGNNLSVDIDNTQTDFGGIVGAGADLNAGVAKLNLGVRYGFGFTNMFENGDVKNGVFSVVAGISL
ncbi:hypothetical protein CK503_03885 [Aliifodinibius salipaludis]|uniref:Outer membrane protein beta-barrel domain-containing protein n=1 Tax=Fodinibius salipaludis TaxID=2032627 RepID=A0A2A2GEC8_9BACT|nr:porin family protein [Aliifodinibius salipaludis]PAU95344.1 hypothetical protein CK503_03885 [Aliifodinibius salipaludis]